MGDRITDHPIEGKPSEKIKIRIPTIPISLSIDASVTVSIPTIDQILENKNLWKVVLYSSILEFLGKIRLRKFFEDREIKQEKWLTRLEKLPLSQVREMLKELQLIDQETYVNIQKVAKVRNAFIHNVLLCSLLFDEDEAKEAVKYAQQCMSVLAKTFWRKYAKLS